MTKVRVKEYAKFVGTLLGAATAATVIWVAHLFHVEMDVTTATALAGVLAALGTLLAPKNAPPAV